MGANDPNFPTSVKSMTAADQYLAQSAAAKANPTFVAKTGSPTLTAAETVNTVVEVSGGSTSTVTLPAAADIIARMQALHEGAAVGDVASLELVNSNSGTMTVTPGANTTFASVGGGSLTTLLTGRYIVKWATATTVTLTRRG